MAAARKNMLVDLGTTWNYSFEYRFNGSPVNLEGHTVVIKITKPGDGTVVYDTQSVEGTSDGVTTFTFADEVTAAWTFTKAAYVVDLHEPDGNVRGLLWGSLTLRDRADV